MTEPQKPAVDTLKLFLSVVILGTLIGGSIIVAEHFPIVHRRQADSDDTPDDELPYAREDRDCGARAARLGLSSLSNPFHTDDRRACAWLSGYMREKERGDRGDRGRGAPIGAKAPDAK